MYATVALVTQIATVLNSLAFTKRTNSGDRKLQLDGDLILGGLFPVHQLDTETNTCAELSGGRGIERVEAMLYALDRINANIQILPGIRLGALILDSCSSPAYALNQSLEFVRDMIGSMDADQYRCSDDSNPTLAESRANRRVAGVVGGSYSSVSIQVANLLRLFRTVQVSPASTNADLSDKTRFEYFARTVPSDNFQARVMADIADYFNWTYVSLVYSEGDYGLMGADAFKMEARKRNICIATEERLSKKLSIRENVDRLITKMQPNKIEGARVVVLFCRDFDVIALLKEAHNRSLMIRSKKIIWLASEGWDRNKARTTEGHETTAQGAIVLKLASKRLPAFEQYYLSLKPGSDTFGRNPWLRELWQQQFDCTFEENDFDHLSKRCGPQHHIRKFNADDKVQFVVDAVYAIAYALHQAWLDKCMAQTVWVSGSIKSSKSCFKQLELIDGQELYNTYLLNVSFHAAAGNQFRFDAQGDGPAYYTILNYQPDNGNRSISSDYVVVGEWRNGLLQIDESSMWWRKNAESAPESVCSVPCRIGNKKQLIKNDEVCCWVCGKCENDEYLINEITCVACKKGWWPTLDRKRCRQLPVQYMQWMSWYSLVPSLVACIGIVFTLLVIIIFVKYNETPIVKASGRELSYILMTAMIVCHLMVFVLLARPSPLMCGLRRISLGLAFAVLYSALLVKTNRIHRIFTPNGAMLANRPQCISPLSQVMITALLSAGQLLISLLWLVIVPPTTTHVYPQLGQVVLSCTVRRHAFLASLGYDALLIVLCTVYAVKTRTVPENFKETKFIGFTMYTTCIIWLAFVPIYFGTGNDFQIQTTTLCLCVSMSSLSTLICIYLPKLWIILFEPEKNVRKKDGAVMLKQKTVRIGQALLCNNLLNESTDNQRRSRMYGSVQSSMQMDSSFLDQDIIL